MTAILDFERIDVLAAGIEHIVCAALETKKAVGVALETRPLFSTTHL